MSRSFYTRLRSGVILLAIMAMMTPHIPAHAQTAEITGHAAAGINGENYSFRLSYDAPTPGTSDIIVWVTLPDISSAGPNATITFISAEGGGNYTASARTIGTTSIPANSIYWERGTNTSGTLNYTVALKNTDPTIAVTYNATANIDAIVPEETPPIQEPETQPEPLPIEEPTEPILSDTAQKGIASIGLAAGTIATVLSLISLIRPPFSIASLFLRLLGFLGLVEVHNYTSGGWGTVFDATTKEPLPLVRVQLTNKEGKILDTVYTDDQGRYGFLPKPGTYGIIAYKEGYTFKNRITPYSSLYGPLHDGEQFAIKTDQAVARNIPLVADGVDWQAIARKRIASVISGPRKFFRRLLFVTFILSFFVSLAAVILTPSVLNIVILCVYIILLALQVRVNKKNYGTVTAGEDAIPVPFAIVSLFGKDTPTKRSAFAVTDTIGRYFLITENGSYTMKIKGQPIEGQSFEKKIPLTIRRGIVTKDVIV